ncbi:MAG TPA: MoaD/ThiS family protein [Nevskiaceae bacterium]|nr:MoaD/ThiS family protein [Nevskiaceae bacterium]
MRITVHCLGPAQRWFGVDELPLELPDTATVQTAIEQLLTLSPAYAETEPMLAYALDEQWADRRTPLHEGAVLALIPPISAG